MISIRESSELVMILGKRKRRHALAIDEIKQYGF
jgi:hypothetical protein